MRKLVPFFWAPTLPGVVRGSGLTDVWVTNGGLTIARWDGTTWTDVSPQVSLANSRVTDMRVLGPKTCEL